MDAIVKIKTIIWLGEVAFEQFQKIDGYLKNKFNNHVVRFDHSYLEKDPEEIKQVYYLKNHFKKHEIAYEDNELRLALEDYLKSKEISYETTLIVGDISEKIAQASIDFSNRVNRANPINEEYLLMNHFQTANFFEDNTATKEEKNILFILPAKSFKDIQEEISQLEERLSNLNFPIYKVKQEELDFNKLLFNLDVGLEKAVSEDPNIELI